MDRQCPAWKTAVLAACLLLGGWAFLREAHAGIVSVRGEVHDSDGSSPIAGDGLKGKAPDGCVQCIYAGPDGRIAPPTRDGKTTGDDVLLETAEYAGQFHTAIGEGFPFSQEGRFYEDFKHDLNVGSKIYCRAWNGSLPHKSSHYGDSALFSLTHKEFCTNPLAPWSTNKRAPKRSGPTKSADTAAPGARE